MKELPQHSSLPESFPKKAARFVLKKAIHTLPASVLLFAACSGGSAAEKNNNQELKNKESSGYTLPFPEGETWFLTTGPHGDGYSNGVRYAIDIAPPEGGFCPPDGRKFTIANRVVTASASGEVVIKGDDRNRNNLDHSVIHIKNENGLTQVYMHLDETKVKLGDRVKQGDPLGNPSCEYPPGGANTGPHVHIGLMKDGQPIPIDGVVVGGWTIHNGVDGKDGTMTKPGEKTRTANTRRYGANSTGIRNDLPNNPNKAVVASPKDPIPPISGQVNEKKVESKNATATQPKSAEAKKEQWKTFKSALPFEVQYPSSWITKDASDEIYKQYLFIDGSEDNNAQIAVVGYYLFNGAAMSPIIDPSNTLEHLVNVEYNSWRRRLKLDYPNTPVEDIIKTTKTKMAGFDAQTLQVNLLHKHDMEYTIYFVVPQPDGLQQVWRFNYAYDTERVPKPEADRTLNRLLDSFKLTQSPKNVPVEKKPVVEKKASLSKKPEELYRALLTSPISSNILPQGMTSRGASASEIDATGKALKQVGAVNILIEDSVSTALKGNPNGGISYSIFPDSSTAKSASEVIGTHLQNGRALNEFPYPAKVYTLNSFFGVVTKMVVMSVENVTLAVIFTGTDPGLLESRAISLGHAAIEHLKKVGQ